MLTPHHNELPAPPSALEDARSRLRDLEQNLLDLLGIADRACGTLPPAGDAATAPKGVPNGLLEEVDNDISRLLVLSHAAVTRLSRIA
jgi:hypothetical protein